MSGSSPETFKTRSAREAGFVLVYVLWIGVAVFAIAMFISQRGREMIRSESAIEGSMAIAEEMASVQSIFKGLIRSGVVKSPYHAMIGACEIELLDANSLLNINSASTDELLRLFEFLEIDRERAARAVDVLQDWVDADDAPRDFGAESAYYETLDPPYSPANKGIQTLDELLLLRGFDPEFIKKIRGYISFAGKSINFSLAPEAVIYAWTGDRAVAKNLIDHRREYVLDDESLRRIMGAYLYNAMLTRYTFSPSGKVRLMIIGEAGRVREVRYEWLSGGALP